MKFCPKCGAQYSGGKFCSKCGYNLSAYLTPEPNPTPAPQPTQSMSTPKPAPSRPAPAPEQSRPQIAEFANLSAQEQIAAYDIYQAFLPISLLVAEAGDYFKRNERRVAELCKKIHSVWINLTNRLYNLLSTGTVSAYTYMHYVDMRTGNWSMSIPSSAEYDSEVSRLSGELKGLIAEFNSWDIHEPNQEKWTLLYTMEFCRYKTYNGIFNFVEQEYLDDFKKSDKRLLAAVMHMDKASVDFENNIKSRIQQHLVGYKEVYKKHLNTINSERLQLISDLARKAADKEAIS